MAVGADGRARPVVPPGTQLYGAHGQPLAQAAPPQAGGGSPYYDYSQTSQTSPTASSYSQFPQHDPNALPSVGQYPRSGSANQSQDSVYLPPVGSGPTAANYSPGSSTSSQGNHLQPGQGHSMSRTPPPARSSPGDGRQDPMALGNIMERQPDAQIDRSMLGRLDRRG